MLEVLKVSLKALSLSRLTRLFCHARVELKVQMTRKHDGAQISSFEDDNFETMTIIATIIATIIHPQSDDFPTTMTFKQL